MYILKEDLIGQLQALPAGARIYATQSGYYADGDFTEVMLEDLPQHLKAKVKEENSYSISHSYQSY